MNINRQTRSFAASRMASERSTLTATVLEGGEWLHGKRLVQSKRDSEALAITSDNTSNVKSLLLLRAVRIIVSVAESEDCRVVRIVSNELVLDALNFL